MARLKVITSGTEPSSPADSGSLAPALESRKNSKAHHFVNKVCITLLRKSREGIAQGEDVLQDACLRILELKEPERIIEPDRYIGRIAKNLLIDKLRDQKRAKAIFADYANAIEIADDQPNAERILSSKEILGHIMAEIDKLPPRCRQAFILHRFDNLTYPAIARTMNVSINTVEKHIAEAMARLVRVLHLKT